MTEDKNRENVPHLEIIEVVLVHCNIVNDDHQKHSRVLYTFVPNRSFDQYIDVSPKKMHIFKKPLIQSLHVLKYGLLIKILNR